MKGRKSEHKEMWLMLYKTLRAMMSKADCTYVATHHKEFVEATELSTDDEIIQKSLLCVRAMNNSTTPVDFTSTNEIKEYIDEE